MGQSSINEPFSMAMLNNQRVSVVAISKTGAPDSPRFFVGDPNRHDSPRLQVPNRG